MEHVDCLKCINSACCKLAIEVGRDEYEVFQAMGLMDSFETTTDKFMTKHPQHDTPIKREQLDSCYSDSDVYAEMKKGDDELCVMLNRETMLCGIYDNRPSVCRDYKTSRCEEIRKCIA